MDFKDKPLLSKIPNFTAECSLEESRKNCYFNMAPLYFNNSLVPMFTEKLPVPPFCHWEFDDDIGWYFTCRHIVVT